MNYLVSAITPLIGIIIGFYLGNSSQRREDKDKIINLANSLKPHKFSIIRPKPKIEPENLPQN
jgi:hypothetical protein